MTNDLPEFALSVRQPWAWAIIHAGKDIENRGPIALRHMGLKKGSRKSIAIHASKGMTRDEYDYAKDFMAGIGAVCPAPGELPRGGIIGRVEVVDVLTKSDSPWWRGPRGIVLTNPVPCEFIPSVGALGLFKWQRADASIVPMPARWMLPAPANPKPAQLALDDDPRLFP